MITIFMIEVLPLIVVGATIGTTLFLHERYDINNIYSKKVVPMIAEACCPLDGEKLLHAYENGLKIVEKSFTLSPPWDVKRHADYLKEMIREHQKFPGLANV